LGQLDKEPLIKPEVWVRMVQEVFSEGVIPSGEHIGLFVDGQWKAV
jgi:hypothetical protein